MLLLPLPPWEEAMRTFAAISLAISLFAYAPEARAHAILVQSSPADHAVLKIAPKQVVLRFNGRIEKKVSELVVRDARGKKVATLTLLPGIGSDSPDSLQAALPPLPPGQYRLEYRVLANDGHTTPGMIRFTIQGPTRT